MSIKPRNNQHLDEKFASGLSASLQHLSPPVTRQEIRDANTTIGDIDGDNIKSTEAHLVIRATQDKIKMRNSDGLYPYYLQYLAFEIIKKQKLSNHEFRKQCGVSKKTVSNRKGFVKLCRTYGFEHICRFGRSFWWLVDHSPRLVKFLDWIADKYGKKKEDVLQFLFAKDAEARIRMFDDFKTSMMKV
jgi:hypothetical protein